MKRLFALALVLILAGCNRPVLSYRALFLAQDAQAAPAFHNGIWLLEPDPECKFDRSQIVSSWPECAEWTLVAQGRIVGAKWRKAPFQGPLIFASHSYILASGEPLILQEPSTLHPWFFGFRAIKPTSLDHEGKIIAATVWDVTCPSAPPTSRDPPPNPERRPIPGLKETKDVCYASNTDAVRAAAKASLEWETPTTMTWLRNGDR